MGHFRNITIQEIDEVPQSELLQLGIPAPSEDDGYGLPEPSWDGPFDYQFTPITNPAAHPHGQHEEIDIMT